MDLIIKGFIIGIGKIIPGVSGAMLAITLGIYEPILEKISNLKKNTIINITFLSKVGLGIILAIIMTSKIIVKCLNNYYFPTMLLFIGMIIGGTKEITKEIKINKKTIIVIIILILIIMLTKIGSNNTPKQISYTIPFFLSLIGIGFLDAASSIIPGISGTALLMSLGYYNIIIEMFGTILNPSYIPKNMFIATPFSIGILLGILIISKILNFLFKKYKNITYTAILILIIATALILIKNTITQTFTYLELLIGIPLFILGIITSLKLSTKK